MERILDGHTRGICELSINRVRFLHRSAAEWIRGDEMWDEIRSKSPPDFEPSMSLLESTVMHYSTNALEVRPDLVTCSIYVVDGFDFAYRARSSNRVSEDRLIQALDGVNAVIERFKNLDPNFDEKQPTKGNLTSFSANIWLVYQHNGRLECSYVGAAARAGLTFYVKNKVSQDKSLLLYKPNRGSLLEANIFDRIQADMRWNTFTKTQHSLLQGCRVAGARCDRLDVIRFLLENEENHCTIASGEPLYDAVKRLAPGKIVNSNDSGGPKTKEHRNLPDDEEWFVQVLKLLEQHGYGPAHKVDNGVVGNNLDKSNGETEKENKGGRQRLFKRLAAKLKMKRNSTGA
ncbi:hypothetical protein B0J13DRAFT_647582 [Dactylonectria estremocensis]|uniref:Uncharacterized protein n=1 Tax=Dactylonectria estremocensis TaxID=1079267 RepID=A0A9P9DQ36_9HYPO|nr:hypothetical protein B0J13DRAFT_647582 [Dactylonectria estremocensis]